MKSRKILPIFVVLLLIIFVGIFLYAFSQPNAPATRLTVGYREELLPYNFSAPHRIIELPPGRSEISGISLLDENTLVFIEDEWGIVYTLDINSGKITGEFMFANDGDFEDIQVVDSKVYTLRSNGKIYRIKDLGLSSQRDKKYETPLNSQNDCEGLTYDPQRDCLLIACKGASRLNSTSAVAEMSDERSVFAFNLAGPDKKLIEEPYYVLDFSLFRSITHNTMDAKDFRPSGIAMHPVDGNLYIITSVGDALIVINREGELIAQAALPEKVFKQPEGICFAPDGTLYISNEGRDGPGNILIFTVKH